ncbi:DUF5946 family protein [Roseobacter sinensis]|uniref:DUF5946 family protein n=1 Tax=Roseobacter sinensis TaxID=2931391 RepID=A0ABT3BK20_9RHOB|nr:DUF5946 family protein [Roseobacter sp. WL0113]MCV3273890.1 DUF5946 family protein [Roseobacter sp. WL0113]
MDAATVCEGCAGRFAAIDGPLHDYLTVSAGCWARFGQALAMHYSDHRYWPAHQLLTDAYVLQHSRGNDRRSIQSVHVHLAALYAQLCLGHAEPRSIALRRALAEFDFKPLSKAWPIPRRSIETVELAPPEQHLPAVKDYAWSVLEDWEPFHDLAERICRV